MSADHQPWAEIGVMQENEQYPGQRDNIVTTSRYTPLSFVPLILYEYLRVLANVYFLFVLAISFLPTSPVSWIFSLIPVVFVLAVTMIKSGIEDYMKHREDKKQNNLQFEIFRNGEWKYLASSDLRPGDFYRISDQTIVPCDTLYVSSSNIGGNCTYSEASLNGESAIKSMFMHQAFKCMTDVKSIQNSGLKVQINQPNRDLSNFNAVIIIGEHKYPISKENILLRGMKIQYTRWVSGIALTTGHDTKIVLNTRHAPAKKTSFDKDMNGMIILIFIIMAILVLILTGLYTYYNKQNLFPIIAQYSINKGKVFAETLLAYLVLYSYMIPMCLIVTIEVLRFIQMLQIQWDMSLSDYEGQHPVPHNSNVTVELGQVTHVLTDKTGTLTENIMELVKFVDNTGICGAMELSKKSFNEISSHEQMILSLALCNTAIVYTEENGRLAYNAESPDESAFVHFAGSCGYNLIERDQSKMVLEINGNRITYDIECIFPFSSSRKRMSIVVRKEGEKDAILFMKGADRIIYERSKSIQYLDELNRFALGGYRTLVFGSRLIPEEELSALKNSYTEACNTLIDREKAIDDVSNLVEHNLDVVGVTAIEDRLQEEVPETIAWLRRALISVWVLTGDMLETAVEIGKTSGVIPGNSDVLILGKTDPTEIEQDIKKYSEELNLLINPVLVIGEKSAEYGLHESREAFMQLAMRCRSVIFSRVSPFMKGQIVAAVKECPGTITLAIGDGGNDVGMIQESHVGVGVMGHEGTAAAQASDFAVPRFKHLKILIGVHGHLASYRLPLVAAMIIYKNIIFIMVVFFASLDAKFSPNSYYNSFLMTCYNFVYTLLPPGSFGMLDKDVQIDVMASTPELHRSERNPLKIPFILYYFGLGVGQAAVIYYFVREACPDITFEEGGTLCYFIVVFTATLQMCFWTSDWNYLQFLSLGITIILLFGVTWAGIFLFMRDQISPLMAVMSSGRAWFVAVLAIIVSLAISVISEQIMNMYFPTISRLLREAEHRNDDLYLEEN